MRTKSKKPKRKKNLFIEARNNEIKYLLLTRQKKTKEKFSQEITNYAAGSTFYSFQSN